MSRGGVGAAVDGEDVGGPVGRWERQAGGVLGRARTDRVGICLAHFRSR